KSAVGRPTRGPMPAIKPHSQTTTAAPTLADPSPRRRAPSERHEGPRPAPGGPGAHDRGPRGPGDAEGRPLGLRRDGSRRGPWPEEVYARRRLEQVDFLIALRAGIDADVRLGQEIRERLDGHEGIDAATIIVVTECGEVTLYGVVVDAESRQLAADLVAPIWGVTAVHNYLRVPA